MPYIVMAYIAMAHIAMAYIGMAYLVMAQVGGHSFSGEGFRNVAGCILRHALFLLCERHFDRSFDCLAATDPPNL